MKTHQLTPRILLFLAAGLFALALLSGCSEDSPVAPENTNTEQAPVLPDPANLKIDLSFFDDGDPVAKAFGHQNFFNAYLRAVIVTAMTDLVLAPPVAAFALALHTVPNHQQDGSWIWVYTFVDGDEEAQIRLRGMVDEDLAGELVRWEMRVTVHNAQHDLEQALWFDGFTRDDGDIGHWTFYDLDFAEAPAAANLDWTHASDRNELRLEALRGDDAGDTLAFSTDGDEHRIDFSDDSSSADWFIRWDEADGSGSLLVPDYNGGEEACWDTEQYDVDCN